MVSLLIRECPLQPPRVQRRVKNRRLDLPVSKPILYQSHVGSLLHHVKPAAMAQAVGMDRPLNPGELARALYDPKPGAPSEWLALFAQEDNPLSMAIRRELLESLHFLDGEIMDGSLSVLGSMHIQRSRFQIKLGPLEADQLRRPEPVAKRHEDHELVSVSVVSAGSQAGGDSHPFELGVGHVFVLPFADVVPLSRGGVVHS